MRRIRKLLGIPVLKLPPNRVLSVILALRDHEYDRDGFRSTVLSLFPGKEEKSVFRGMAIPTLRGLGLLIGFESEMHLSGDGSLVAAAYNPTNPGDNEPMQLLLRATEKERELGAVWRKRHVSISDVRHALSKADKPGKEKRPIGDFLGRANRWLSYLEFFNIVVRKEKVFQRLLLPLRSDPQIGRGAIVSFAKELLSAYRNLMPGGVGEPVIAIEAIHRELALQRWKTRKVILIRRDFDRLLERCLRTGILDIHLHRSMGAEQGLFMHEGISYQTMSIRER
jgi:hypothetical protein